MRNPRRELAERCKRLTLQALEAHGGQATREQVREWVLGGGHLTDEQLAMPGPPSRPQYPRLVDECLASSMLWLKREGRVRPLGSTLWTLTDGPATASAPRRPAPRRRWPWARDAA
jgi:hypothetical protein